MDIDEYALYYEMVPYIILDRIAFSLLDTFKFPLLHSIVFLFLTIITYHTVKEIRVFREAKKLETVFIALEKYAEEPKTYECFKGLINLFPDTINKCRKTDGNTPFLIACWNGATDLVEFLIAKGADISKTNKEGEGPFFLATYYFLQNRKMVDASCLRALFYAGCDINAKTKDGYTALHLASQYGHEPLIKWLLSKGADPEIKPLPAGLALANGFKHVAGVLLLKAKANRVIATE